jgi:zinc transporter 1
MDTRRVRFRNAGTNYAWMQVLMSLQAENAHENHNHETAAFSTSQNTRHSHSHSHDLGIKALILHLMCDVLNNIGVIISAAIIWAVPSQYRFYADPSASMFIAFVILIASWKLGKT